MSRNYSFSAMLNLNYTKENVLSILKNGEKKSCVYENYAPGISQSDTITIDAALSLVWLRYLERYEYGPLIETKYTKTHFTIWFYNKNNKIELCIYPDHIAWKKYYDLSSWYGINFYRYQTFMLRLIGDNIITHFQTYEWFQEPYDAEDMGHDKKIYVKLYTYWAYDVYHHLLVNASILRITWLDSNKLPINTKNEYNALEDIIQNVDTRQYWYGIHGTTILKFSLTNDRCFIIEPINQHTNDGNFSQEEKYKEFDIALRFSIELFKNLPVLRLITFKSDKNIININKMNA